MIKINTREIGEGNPAYIIAEMGINHNGKVDIAMKMVEGGAKAGVDAIKLQIVYSDKSYTKDTDSYTIFKKVELSTDEWEKVIILAKDLGIDVFATFTHPEDISMVEQYDLPAIKISSSNINNFPLLKTALKVGKPLLLSTGLSYLSEIDEAIRFLERNNNKQIGLLQCTALYPTIPEYVNLNVIKTLKRAYPYPVGYSDHTIGNSCAIASVALGASIIEKHFTLDKSMEGPDHHFSATPEELRVLVKAVREVESSLGSYVKHPVPDEIPQREVMQRILVAAKNIEDGEVITKESVLLKRSLLKGLTSKYYDLVIGRKAKKNIPIDIPITFDLI
jgi:N-acetylneuraminate synthase/N,N'-diacetyllegionaminate synthase|tara:strand:+ start:3569 stop:4570 length:1002 start_codon:yes stop_codon:yes gene_type:complete